MKDKITVFELLIILLLTGQSLFELLYILSGEKFQHEFNVFNLVILSALSIYIILTRSRKLKFSLPIVAILSFFLIYFIRIIFDNLIQVYNPISFIKYSGRYIGNVILPCCALLFIDKINISKISQCILVIFIVYFTVHLTLNGLGPNANIVTFGARAQHSGLLFILSLALFYYKPRYWYLLGVFLGIFFLVFYARKAPVIGALVIFFYFLALWIRDKEPLPVICILFTALIAFIFNYVNIFNVIPSTSLLDRGFNFLFKVDTSTQIRYQAINLALNQFFASPVFGSSMGIKNFKPDYPHNIYVESLMAVGIVGTLPLLLYIMHILRVSLNLLSKKKFLIISILFLYFFIQSLFNGSLYWVYTLWISSILVCVLTDTHKFKTT